MRRAKNYLGAAGGAAPFALSWLLAIGAGCHKPVSSQPSTRPTSAPAATTASSQPGSAPSKSDGPYVNQKAGIRLDYPAGWISKPSKDYDLLLVPSGAQGTERTISLDIPDLPGHVPGMIPMGMVAKGYLDDLRKTAGVAVQTQQEQQTIPKAQARLLVSKWQRDGKTFCDTALVIVHSDHVYILRAACDGAQEPPTRQAFDAIAHSLQWTK